MYTSHVFSVRTAILIVLKSWLSSSTAFFCNLAGFLLHMCTLPRVVMAAKMASEPLTASCSDGTSPEVYGVQNISQNILVGDKRVLVTPLLPVQGGQATMVTRKAVS